MWGDFRDSFVYLMNEKNLSNVQIIIYEKIFANAQINSDYMFIKHILREKSPSGRFNSNYIIP